MQSLIYPVVVENKYGASSFLSHEKLCTCGEEWVDCGNLIGSFVIDNIGKVFQVRGVKKIKNNNLLPKCLVPYGRRTVLVEYDLNYINTLDFQSLKERFLRLYGAIGSEDDLIIDELNTAATISELIETFGVE